MNLMSKIAKMLGLTPDELAKSKKYPANPDRRPHNATSHPQSSGTHRTRNSAFTVNAVGQRQGIAHGPQNVYDHPIFRGYHVARSKYQPRIDTPKHLRTA